MVHLQYMKEYHIYHDTVDKYDGIWLVIDAIMNTLYSHYCLLWRTLELMILLESGYLQEV